jgi:hypothetical protein
VAVGRIVPPMEHIVVVASPGPLPEVIDRSHWPAHITVVSNFRADLSGIPAISHAVRATATRLPPFEVVLGPTALFGTEGDVPVLLAEHAFLHQLHESIGDAVAGTRCFQADHPAFWGSGYRPHATLGPSVGLSDAELLRITHLVVVSLQTTTGRPITTAALGEGLRAVDAPPQMASGP